MFICNLATSVCKKHQKMRSQVFLMGKKKYVDAWDSLGNPQMLCRHITALYHITATTLLQQCQKCLSETVLKTIDIVHCSHCQLCFYLMASSPWRPSFSRLFDLLYQYLWAHCMCYHIFTNWLNSHNFSLHVITQQQKMDIDTISNPCFTACLHPNTAVFSWVFKIVGHLCWWLINHSLFHTRKSCQSRSVGCL